MQVTDTTITLTPDEAARRAVLYPDLLAALGTLYAAWDTAEADLCGVPGFACMVEKLDQARAVIARCKGGAS